MDEKDKVLKAGEARLNMIPGVEKTVFQEEVETEDGQLMSTFFVELENDGIEDEVAQYCREVDDERFVLIPEIRHGLYASVKTTIGDYRSVNVKFDVSGTVEKEVRVDDEEVAVERARQIIETRLPDELELRVLEVE